MGLLHVRSLTLSIQGHYYVQSRVVTTFLEALEMRADTYTYHAVIDGPAITVNSDLTDKPSKGPGLEDVSVCARCSEEIFSPVTWAHLRGDTLAPPIPNVDSDTSDYHIMNDLDFVVRMFNAGQNPRKRGPMVDFKIPAKDLLKSSQESCGFCKLLVRLDRHGRLPAQPDETSVLRLQAFWPEKVNGSIYPMMLEVGLHPTVSGGGEAWPLTFFDERGAVPLLSSNADASNIDKVRKPLLQQAAKWIENCERTHHECSRSQNQRSPTRLLDLLHLWDQERLHLVESAHLLDARYAVLSYVWGTTSTIHLTRTTQSSFKRGLAFDVLPQTIKDTVLVTDRLHIRYLWIDALCILQDSNADKEHEIPRMNEYYQNALVVISASMAKDVHSGFTFYQMTGHDRYIELQNPGPRRQSLTGPVPLRIPGHFPNYSTSLLVDTIPLMYRYKREPINNRAWTLQESVLPRRLLTFPMTGGLSMTCREGEVLAGEIVSDPYGEVPRFNSLGIVSSNRHTADELAKLWTQVVEDYTQRSLSHRSDILVAIGALAREFHTKHGAMLGGYLAGLWENHVRSSLLWHNTNDLSISQTEGQGDYFAPSWSWASCPWPIVFSNKPEWYLPLGDHDPGNMYIPRWYCEVLSSEVTPQSDFDRFGAVQSGSLTVQGPLRPLVQQPDVSEGGTKVKYKSHGCPNLKLEEALSSAEMLALDRPLVAHELNVDEDQQYHWFGVWYAGRSRARGLIVQQVNKTSFRRLGFAEFMVDEEEFPSSELHKERTIHLV